MKKLMFAVMGGAMAMMAGCVSGPVQFLESSTPVPEKGYTVAGSEVSGTSDHIWIFGFGGSMDNQQARAYRDAISRAQQADALVGMSIEEHYLILFPLFVRKTIDVTGTPVRFNK